MFSRWIFVIQVLLLAVMIVAVLAYRFGWILFPPLATTFAVTAMGLLGFSCVALLMLCWSMVVKRFSGVKHLLGAFSIAALPIISILVSVGVEGFKVPRIHDISTDLEDPPEFSVAQTVRHSSENSLIHGGAEVSKLQREAYPMAKSLRLSVSPLEAFESSGKALRALGWEIISERAESFEYEAVEASAMFGFKDDVIVRVRPSPQGAVVDVRSVSRVGESDLGANAKRIARFYQALNQVQDN